MLGTIVRTHSMRRAASVISVRMLSMKPSIPPATIPLILDQQARVRPDSTALLAFGKGTQKSELTYSTLFQQMLGMAAGLRELGYQRGDAICQTLPNCSDNVVLQLGAAAAGVSVITAKDSKGVTKIVETFKNCKGLAITGDQSNNEEMIAWCVGV